jgi:arsenate reductase
LDNKTRVLFMCVHNSCRSQMAEAFLRELAPDRFEAFSAGLEATTVDPLAIEAMAERGIDISSARAKDLAEYLGKLHFGYVITVCERANRECPKTFPGMGTRLHWPFADPDAVQGDHDERLPVYREVRDAIEMRIREWLDELAAR